MVVILLIIQIEKSKIILSQVYTEELNDDKTKIREIYIRDKIIEEYLFLKSIENDQMKVAMNQLPSDLVIEHFNEKYHIDNAIKYEGILIIDKLELFNSQKNIFWKYHLGYCIVLVCDDFENIQMASNFISILQLFLTKEAVCLYYHIYMLII